MYENIFSKYDANWAGKKLRPKQTVEIGLDAPELRPDGKYAVVTATINVDVIAITTGRYLTFGDGSIGFQIQYNGSYGYIFSDTLDQWAIVADNGTARSAQSEFDQLIANNKRILENNLLCVAAIDMCEKTGVALPAKFRADVVKINNRLSNRNEQIKNSGVVSDMVTASSPDMSVYNQKLIDFIANPGIGIVISGTVALIVSGIILLTGAAIAYALFKKLNAESKVDMSYSDELTAELMRFLPPKVYEQLMKENAANEKKATEAINNASGKSFLTTAKYLAVGFLGFWAIDKFLQNRK